MLTTVADFYKKLFSREIPLLVLPAPHVLNDPLSRRSIQETLRGGEPESVFTEDLGRYYSAYSGLMSRLADALDTWETLYHDPVLFYHTGSVLGLGFGLDEPAETVSGKIDEVVNFEEYVLTKLDMHSYYYSNGRNMPVFEIMDVLTRKVFAEYIRVKSATFEGVGDPRVVTTRWRGISRIVFEIDSPSRLLTENIERALDQVFLNKPLLITRNPSDDGKKKTILSQYAFFGSLIDKKEEEK